MKKKNSSAADLPPKLNSVVLNVEGNIFVLSGSLEQINGLVIAQCTASDPVRLDLWLKRDTWTSEEAFLLMNGLDPTGTKIGKHANFFDFDKDTYIDEFKHIAFLDGRSVDLPRFNAVCAALVEAGMRRKDDEQISCFKTTCWKTLDCIKEMQEIYLSGKHPERNPAAFYLAWAEKKGFKNNTIAALHQKVIVKKELLRRDVENGDDKCGQTGNESSESAALSELSPRVPLAASKKPLAFKPKVGWQIALFDSWPDICRLYSRQPSIGEAINWLKGNDTSGVILNKKSDDGFWWKPERGNQKEVVFKTVANVISGWRIKGVLPA